MNKTSKLFRYVFMLIGIALLVELVRRIGVDTIAANIALVGWRFLLILAISGMWLVLNTSAWMQFLVRLGDKIKFFDLFKIKLAGEAVNTLTPINFIGGDPMRIYLLKKNFPVAESAASVVVDRTLHSAASLIVIITGISIAFVNFDSLPGNLKFGVPIALLVSVAFMLFILIHQRRGFFGLILSACRKSGVKKEFSEKTVNRFMELDSHIVDFYKTNHKGFIQALSYHTIARFLGVAEIYIVGKACSDEFSLFAAVVLTALAPIVNAVFAFIPGAIGVLEGAYSGVLYLMHMDPAIGITIQIAKRIRSLFWIALGLYFLGAHDRKMVWEDEKLIEEV